MAYMYFTPDSFAGVDEAAEELYATAQQIDPSIEIEAVEESYPGSGTLEAAAPPEALDALKRGAEERGIPVTAERIEYAPEEASAVGEIFDGRYFQ